VPKQFKENLEHDAEYLKALTQNPHQRNLERVRRLKVATKNSNSTYFEQST